MEYPPVKPHHKALHELRKDFIYEKFKESFEHILELAGDDAFAQLEVYSYYYAIFMTMSKLDDAKQIIEMSRKVTITEGNNDQKALSLLIEAQYNIDESNLESAKVQNDEALSLLKESSGELFYKALARNTRLVSKSDFDEQIKVFTEIIEKCPENYLLLIADTHLDLAFTYKNISAYDDSAKCLNYSLSIYEKLQYKDRVAMVHHLLGVVARARFEIENDKKYLFESIEHDHITLEMESQISGDYGKFMTLSSLGESYADLAEFPKALKYCKEALGLARKNQYKPSIGLGLLHFGVVLNKSGQYSESLRYLDECLQYADIVGHNTEVNRIGLYQELCMVCNRLNLYEKGFAYSQKLYELQKAYDEKVKVGIVYHNTQLSEELHKQKLRAMEEKVQLQAAQLVSQTDLLAKFRDELREIVRQSPSTDPTIRAVKEKLKELPCKSIDWEKFEAEFAAVHPEFTRKIYERCQTLTPMEVKMCSLLRLNLKSQEIGRLFCLSDRTVENHRFNIRRKLGLDREQSISVYLNSL